MSVFAGNGGDGEFLLAGGAGSRRYGKPFGVRLSNLHGPAVRGVHFDGPGAAFLGEADVRRVYFDLAEEMIGLFYAGGEKSGAREQGCNDISEFHKIAD